MLSPGKTRGGSRGGWIAGRPHGPPFSRPSFGLRERAQPSLPIPSPEQKLIETASLATIRVTAATLSTTIKIEQAEYVASYNWLDGSRATIVVPGSPPAWLPPASPPKLMPDSGDYFRDPNAARSPRFPTEPAIKALFHLNPDFDGRSIDVVACGNTLGCLLSFVGSHDRTFHFGIEVIGKTLFFVRKGKSATELINGVYGYGHTFPEAYTTWDANVKGSASHQRLVRYEFGGLQMLIRSETDGYLPSKVPHIAKSPRFEKTGLHIADLSMKSEVSKIKQNLDKDAPLNIQDGGQSVPQSAIFDLKTRSANNEYDLEDILPRLWINQTPNFILAYHKSGRFVDIRVEDMKSQVLAWQKMNSLLLRDLRALLSWIVGFMEKKTLTKLEVRRDGRGALQMWTGPNSWAALPPELKKRWKNPGHEDSKDKKDRNGDLVKGIGKGIEMEDDSEDEEDDDDYLRF